MKKYILFFLFVIQGLLVVAQKDKEPYMTKSLSNENVKTVTVETSGGSITVTGVAPSEARIEVYVSGNNDNKTLSKEEIGQRLNELYELNVSVSNNNLTAKAKQKDRNQNWIKALNITFKVFVPKNISSELTTSGGSIRLTNLAGSQDFTTSGGSLHIDNVSGKIDGRTSGGSIELKNSKDEIELSTSGGSIQAKNCEGKLRLTTSGGSLNLKDLSGEIRATTSGGSVQGSDIKGELITHTSGGGIHLVDLSCSLEASTSAGGINVSFKELGKYVRISNSAGNVELQLPKNKGIDLELSADRINTGQMESFNGKMDDDEVDGKLYGGGVPVTVRASAGRINLVLK